MTHVPRLDPSPPGGQTSRKAGKEPPPDAFALLLTVNDQARTAPAEGPKKTGSTTTPAGHAEEDAARDESPREVRRGGRLHTELPAGASAPAGAEDAAVAADPAPVGAVSADRDATPAVPATPAASASPAVPATPAASASPAVPATPAASASPAVPATPAMPADAAVPAAQAVPVTPAGHATPAVPATPASPGAPAVPATPAVPAANGITEGKTPKGAAAPAAPLVAVPVAEAPVVVAPVAEVPVAGTPLAPVAPAPAAGEASVVEAPAPPLPAEPTSASASEMPQGEAATAPVRPETPALGAPKAIAKDEPVPSGAPATQAPANANAATPAAPATPNAQTIQPPARPLHAPAGLHAENAAQVRELVQVAATRGAAHARLQLHPAELGGIEIRIRSTAEGVTATIAADRPEALQALQQAGDELRRSLEDRGLNVLSLDVSLSEAKDQRRADDREASSRHDFQGRPGGESHEDPETPTTTRVPAGALVDLFA